MAKHGPVLGNVSEGSGCEDLEEEEVLFVQALALDFLDHLYLFNGSLDFCVVIVLNQLLLHFFLFKFEVVWIGEGGLDLDLILITVFLKLLQNFLVLKLEGQTLLADLLLLEDGVVEELLPLNPIFGVELK